VFAKPEAAFTTEPVCLGQSTSFDNESSEADGFAWQFGDLSGSSTVEDPGYTYLNPGVYEARLIASTRQGCADTVSNPVEVFDLPVADFSVENECIDAPVAPVDQSQGAVESWAWRFGDGQTGSGPSPTNSYNQPGEYVIALTVTDDNQCVDSTRMMVEVFPLPDMGVTSDTTISQGDTVQLGATGGVEYVWSPTGSLNDPDRRKPIARPLEESVTYNVIITNEFGCTDDTSVTVSTLRDFTLRPTNLFTPDGNGQNETWEIGNIDIYQGCRVAVFNRWGQEVFSSNSYQNDWRGTYEGDELPDGTYYYIIDCPDQGRDYKGAITILAGDR
jgi:gliding motility-associated-like protein